MIHVFVALVVAIYILCGTICHLELGRAVFVLEIVFWAELCFALLICIYEKNKNSKVMKMLVGFVYVMEVLSYFTFLIFSIRYYQMYWFIMDNQNEFITECERDIEEFNECVLVMGSQLENGQMDSHLKARLEYLIEMTDFENGCKRIYVLTGGTGRTEHSNVSEAEMMLAYLFENGIKENEIYLEKEALSTYENIILTRQLWEEKKLIVISSAYHLPRIQLILEDLGCSDYVLLGAEQGVEGESYRMIEEIIGMMMWKIGIR